MRYGIVALLAVLGFSAGIFFSPMKAEAASSTAGAGAARFQLVTAKVRNLFAPTGRDPHESEDSTLFKIDTATGAVWRYERLLTSNPNEGIERFTPVETVN